MMQAQDQGDRSMGRLAGRAGRAAAASRNCATRPIAPPPLKRKIWIRK
jgi:hypothetical protein